MTIKENVRLLISEQKRIVSSLERLTHYKTHHSSKSEKSLTATVYTD